MARERIAVAMSGGVDSSVAALLLREEGYEVVGLTMKLWEDGSRCCSLQDAMDAKRVAAQLGIAHYTVNLKEEFSREVVDYFVSDYLEGRTPNPCVVCNREIKFGALLRKAEELGASYLATGHYAQVSFERGRYHLRRGKDEDRDQSYFLAMLNKDSLAKVKFPLETLSKGEVRRMAENAGLKVANKGESQEVCFVLDGDCGGCVRRFAPVKEGVILTKEGKSIGTHEGIVDYTVGQRRGFGFAVGRPLYVMGIDRESNAIIVGDEEDLYARTFLASSPNWIVTPRPGRGLKAVVKIRYRHVASEARVTPEGDRVLVEFESPQRAITPGQLAVFYEGDRVLGGAWIEKTLR